MKKITVLRFFLVFNFLQICCFSMFVLSFTPLLATTYQQDTPQMNYEPSNRHDNQNSEIKTIVIAHRISSEEELMHYMYYVEEVVQKHKFYPPIAKTMKQEGRCVLQFEINRDGTIHNAVLLEPTSNMILNQAALEILERIGTFKSFPTRLKRDFVLINIPIRYSIKE